MKPDQNKKYSLLLKKIRQQIENNVEYETIEKFFLSKGWSKKLISKAYKELKNNSEDLSFLKKKHFFSKAINKAKNKKHVEKEMPEKSSFLIQVGKEKGITSDAIVALTRNQIEMKNYVEKLFDKRHSRSHFYQDLKKTYQEKEKEKKDEKKNFDVLKQAIMLAQEVVKNQKYQTIGNVEKPNNPVANLFQNSENKKTEDSSGLDDELEQQRLLIEKEREMIRKERERLEEERKKLIESPKKIVVEKKIDKKPDKVEKSEKEGSLRETELELKLSLLEERLKNMDYKDQSSSEGFKNEIIPDEIEFVSEPVGDRAQTGIIGLDPVIQGGLRRLSSTLIAGGPGSGKTIFGMQFLISGIEQSHEAGVYITFEQTKQDLYNLFAPFGWNLERLESEKKLIILQYTPEQIAKMMTSGGGSLRDAIDSIHASRVVIDSLSDLMMLFKKDLEKRAACSDLFELFRKLNCTAMVISEQEVNPLKHISTVLEYQVDGVILLYNERVGDIRQRALEIFKMRGTKHAGRIFPMKITDSGILILSENKLK